MTITDIQFQTLIAWQEAFVAFRDHLFAPCPQCEENETFGAGLCEEGERLNEAKSVAVVRALKVVDEMKEQQKP